MLLLHYLKRKALRYSFVESRYIIHDMEAKDEEKISIFRSPPRVPQAHPWLLIGDQKNSQRRNFYSISEDRYYVQIIPTLQNQIIRGCCVGWLVLEDSNSNEFCLLDMVSMKKIQLPPLESSDNYGICILSSSPSSPDCRVLFIDRFSGTVSLCKPGDNKFKKHQLDFGNNNDNDGLFIATAFHGKIYGYTINASILMVLDFSGPTPQFQPVLTDASPRKTPHGIIKSQHVLIESCGELLLVRKLYFGFLLREVLGFVVFRADFSGRRWVKMESIGERAIFLCNYAKISCSTADSGIKGNSIYFTEEGIDRCLYIFDLENQTMLETLPCATVSRSESMFNWIMMPISESLLKKKNF